MHCCLEVLVQGALWVGGHWGYHQTGMAEVWLGPVRKSNRGFFAHHPRTYPKELTTLFGAPGTFGAPFSQNDTVVGR